VITIAFVLMASLAWETTFYLSMAAAFLGLTVLHHFSHRLSGDAVRALADFALFTPLPVIGLVSSVFSSFTYPSQ